MKYSVKKLQPKTQIFKSGRVVVQTKSSVNYAVVDGSGEVAVVDGNFQIFQIKKAATMQAAYMNK